MAEETGQAAAMYTEISELKRRTYSLESNSERHEKDIRELYKHQEGTKVYVTQILESINKLDTKLFTLVAEREAAVLRQHSEAEKMKERRETAADRATERKDWKELIKYVVGATVGALIYYAVTGG